MHENTEKMQVVYKKESLQVSYEKIYFSLWEISQRYHSFAMFRVIGESHDQRFIPMLEIGKGDSVIFCISGIQGTDIGIPFLLVQLAEEYCRAYECQWILEDFYEVKQLLDKIRICMIPLLNPDGYEFCRIGFRSIRNPIYRQMLRMKEIPREEFIYNARAVDLKKNFPAGFYSRKRIAQEPGSENETKALMHIFQEYRSKGLLSFVEKNKEMVYYHHMQGFMYNQRSGRLARHLQKCAERKKDKDSAYLKGMRQKQDSVGSPEQFYAERIKEPSLEIEIPVSLENKSTKCRDIRLLPLEYIFSLDQ